MSSLFDFMKYAPPFMKAKITYYPETDMYVIKVKDMPDGFSKLVGEIEGVSIEDNYDRDVKFTTVKVMHLDELMKKYKNEVNKVPKPVLNMIFIYLSKHTKIKELKEEK